MKLSGNRRRLCPALALVHLAAVSVSKVVAWARIPSLNTRVHIASKDLVRGPCHRSWFGGESRVFPLLSLRTQVPTTALDSSNNSINNDDEAVFAPIDANASSDSLVKLHQLLRPDSSCDADRMSGTDLAYVGDAVYELFVRCRTVWPLKRTADLQQQAVALVRAEHQSLLLLKLRFSDFLLTPKEQQVLNRGRNAASKRHTNNNRRHPTTYQDSTALEALLGYLFVSDSDRCAELMQWIHANIDD